ncbi:MAG: integrase arm-type DNA-binding domain-containing protein [Alphaproteobacteria bacterium]|nr:integrase arm-type DNA-binding domain-containing protein [Alphaproteobacteria bacterium]MCL2505157.1 integrase arm-type DNA-binding domain-containing protein [Alphaproteobacteria bacterium]
MKLTDKSCKAAKTKKKSYKLADGGGLYLEVMPNGSKYWRMKYRYLGKEKRLAFGVYPLISLLEAREKRDKAKKLLINGTDPQEFRQEEKQNKVRNAQNTFQVIALEWLENQKERWTAGYAAKIIRTLEMNIFPFIGTKPIANIEAPALLDVLRKVEKRGALEIAGRTLQICGSVFRYGIQTGRCSRDPAHDLRGALKTRKTTHFASLDIKDIPEFLQALERNSARLYDRTRRAIRLSLLTFTRPGELRQARWEEIDLKSKQWTIPAERMKMKRAHIVPLCRQALKILDEQRDETGMLKTPWVFPSQVSPMKPMSDGTVNVALKRLGYHERMTAHGFRALARTTIREKLDYAPDIIEAQLAHKAPGPLGEAYDRAQFIKQCHKMMQEWADYLDSIT